MTLDLASLLRLLARFERTFSTRAPPVVARSRREAVRLVLLHRQERRVLQRHYRAAVGCSIFTTLRRRRRHRAATGDAL